MTLARLSIRARLTVAFAAALLLVLALAGLFVYLRVSSELTGTIDDGLRSRIDDLSALVAGSGSGQPQLSGTRLVESEEGFSQVLDPSGAVVASTLGPGSRPAIDSAEVARTGEGPLLIDREIPGVEGEARILAAEAESPQGSFVIVAGASTDDRSETLDGIARAFLLGAPLALLLASGLGYLLASRSLAPVEAMGRRAQEITLERSGERLPLPPTEDEINRLGKTLNAMLDRLEASLERERVFVADASHELRTPLSVLRAELELADRPDRTPEQVEAALRSAAEEVDRLSRLAEDLLVIARSDRGRLPIRRESIAVDALLRRVSERFGGRAGERGREIVVEAPTGIHAELDVFRMEQALGNLVDNALRHGGGKVRLAARRDDGLAVIEVTDRGPGFPDGFEGRAFERFTRADQARTGRGAGLGLAIVQAVAKAHGGGVEIVGLGGDGVTLRMAVPLREA